MTGEPDYLRAIAGKCRRLMQGESDAYTLERLTMMAEEFERSALAAEQGGLADTERRAAGQVRSGPAQSPGP